MIKVFQTRGASPQHPGDCFTACIASLLDRPLKDIPDWFNGLHNGQEVTSTAVEDMRTWFQMIGLYYFEFAFKMDMQAVLKAMKVHHPGVHYLIIGETRGGMIHAIICKDDEVAHNPGYSAYAELHPFKRDRHIRVGIIGKNV